MPRLLSALTAPPRLSLAGNRGLVGGCWQHLRPLTRLRQMDVWRVPLPNAAPPAPEVAALTWVHPLGCELVC